MSHENEGIRRARFDAIMRQYEDPIGHDSTVLGAGRSGDRFAVLTESTRGFGYSLTYAASMTDAELVAAANIGESWNPLCVFDLDNLAGDEPKIAEGDKVMHDGERDWYVVGDEGDWAEGEPFLYYFLSKDPDAGIDDRDTVRVDESYVSLVERAEPDDRLPARFDVAAVRTFVVFNQVPKGEVAR